MSIKSVIKSESFFEKAFLLVLAAIISGLLIPAVFKVIDHQRSERIALKESKSQLHSDVAETVLRSITLALDVSWFGSKKSKNKDMQEIAFKRYNERIADLMADWRVQYSKSQTLTSNDISEKLQTLQLAVSYTHLTLPTIYSV